MVAYLYRMPTGIAGEVTRFASAVIEPQEMTPVGIAGHPTAYGIPVAFSAVSGYEGMIRSLLAETSVVYGLLVRPFPTAAGTDGLGVATPPDEGAADVLRSGYMTVLLSGSTNAVKGGTVYIWHAAATGTHILGGYEAADPSTDGFALNATFMSDAAPGAVVEIAFNVA